MSKRRIKKLKQRGQLPPKSQKEKVEDALERLRGREPTIFSKALARLMGNPDSRVMLEEALKARGADAGQINRWLLGEE